MKPVGLLALARLSVLATVTSSMCSPSAAMFSAGQFDVSNGVASYSIPVPLPAGIGGATPTLALTYSSAAGNGLVGVGWSLSGLSTVSRCPQTMAQDGARRAVGNDSGDRFCLNGQRLLMVGGGAYGAHGAEYRTEQESFTKVTSHNQSGTPGGPDSFLVKTRDGLTIEYGKTTDSRIEVSGGGSVVAEWAVNKVTDVNGNFYTVSYQEDNANGFYYPRRIEYSSNAGVGVGPAYVVVFDYEGRTDVRLSYSGGAFTRQTLRLKAIRIQTSASIELRRLLLNYNVTPQQVPGAPFSTLQSVQDCAGSSCMPPITFAWNTSGTPWVRNTTFLIPEQLSADMRSEVGARLADLNGDGFPDFVASRWIDANVQTRKVYLNNGSTFVEAPQFVLPQYLSFDPVANGGGQLIDLNGDGLLDFIISRYTGGTPIVKTWINTGQSTGIIWQESSLYKLPDNHFLTADQKANIGAQFADLNGDGLPDFVAARWISAGHQNRQVLLNTPAGWVPAANYLLPEMLAYDPVGHGGGGQLVDLNGDGLLDFIIARYTGGAPIVKTWLNVGNGVGAQSTGTVWQESLEYRLPTDHFLTNDHRGNFGAQLIDLNADGLPDFVTSRWISAGTQTRQALLNTGKGWVASSQYVLPEMLSADPIGHDLGARLIDLNGDGLPDFIHSRSASGTPLKGAWLNTGSGWTPALPAKVDAYILPEYLSDDRVASLGAQLIDINGDGLPDFASSRWTGAQLLRSTLINNTPKLLLAEIRNGSSTLTSISYKELPQIQGNAYKRTRRSAYPNLFSVNPIPVVVEVRSSDGVGGTAKTIYSYGNFKIDTSPSGRGDLGFEWTQSKDDRTQSVRRTYFRQDWPYLGLVSESGTGSGAGPDESNWRNLTHTVNTSFTCRSATGSGGWTNCATPAPNTRYFIYPNQIDARAWDYTGMTASEGVFIALPRTRTQQVLNDYGEATWLRTETLDPATGATTGYSKTTTNTYAPVDPAKWHLNRLIRSSVEATSP